MKFIKNILKWYRYYSDNEINYNDAQTILENDKDAILIDVRSPQEYNEGHLYKAVNIPLYDLEKELNNKLSNKEQQIIVYCQTRQ